MGILETYKKWFCRMTGMLKLGGVWETQYAAYERTADRELTIRHFKGTMTEYQSHMYLKTIAKECGWTILDKDIANYVIIYPSGESVSPEDAVELDVFNRMAGEGEREDEETHGDDTGCPWDHSES